MKSLANLSKLVTLFLVSVLTLALWTVSSAQASVPYTGDTTPAAAVPTFNQYTGVPSIGTEADFLRGKVETSTGYVDPVNTTCTDGMRFKLRVYVHNAASDAKNNNGTGPSIAKGVKVKVALPTDGKTSFNLSSTISSTNTPSVSDGMVINCGGKKYTISYVAGTAEQYTKLSGATKPLSDTIVTTGAPIGTMGPDGNVWGCWDQRVWITLVVKVTEVKEPTKPQALSCKVVIVDRKGLYVSTKIESSATNVSNLKYSTNFNDGSTVVSTQTATHTYKDYGTHKITGTVTGTGTGTAGGTLKANCENQFTENKPEEKPQALTCKVTIVDRKGLYVSTKIESSATNVKDLKYSTNFNDGTVVNAQTATHTYKEYGTHKITGTVTGTGTGTAGGTLKANCETEFTEKKPEVKPQALTCKLLVDRKGLAVGASLQAYATNVTVKSYSINFNDGTVVNAQTAQHVYKEYGDHKITGTVTGTGTGTDGGTLTANCEFKFTEQKPTEPPVEPPIPPKPPVVEPPITVTPEMPHTGPASVVGLISGISAVGAFGHRAWTIRRLK